MILAGLPSMMEKSLSHKHPQYTHARARRMRTRGRGLHIRETRAGDAGGKF